MGWCTARVIAAIVLLLCALLTPLSSALHANEMDVLGQSRATHVRAMALFQELYQMEEGALFPQRQQLRLFITQSFGALVKMQQLQVVIDDVLIAEHFYTPIEIQRFVNGAHHPILTTMIPSGKHLLSLWVTGELGHKGVLEGEFSFTKGDQPKFIEINIRRAMLRFREWE